MKNIIEVKNLTKSYKKIKAIDNLSFEVKEGERLGLLGPNGSGKTTLLSTIAGFKPLTSGTLYILGQEYKKENIFDLRKRVGMVSNSLFDRIYFNESALQIVLSGLFGAFNIEFGIRDENIRFAKKLLQELRMGEKMYQPFGTMSKGERQNVLIARALITKPEILLLDEPTSGLDIYARDHLYQTISALANSGKVTILYVTHYSEEVPAFINKTLLLRNGYVFSQGSVEEMLTSSKVSSLLNEKVCISRDEQGFWHMKVDAPSKIYDLCYKGE